MQLNDAQQLLIRHGFSARIVPPDGYGDVLALGEAPGQLEDQNLIPFHPEAEAGGLFKRLLERVNVQRERFTISNCVWQRPPANELAGTAYEEEALAAWWPHVQALILERRPKAILALGGTALRQLTRFQSILTTRGYVHSLDMEGWECPVVATYHPSFLNHGQQHLSGVFIHDVLLALELAEKGWRQPRLKTIPTPSIGQFQAFCDGYNPERHKLTFDIETPESEGVDEDVVEEDLSRISFHITRASFCYDSSVGGISIPWQEPFITPAKTLLASNGPKRSWNGRLFDRPRLERNGCVLNGREYDLMDQWRHLHRTLPASVAFVAPFYLRMPPYKHLAHYQPEWYSAMDAIVEHEIAEGMERDMRSMGQWETYERHVVDMISHHGICSQMARNGLPYSAQEAERFGKELEHKRLARVERMQEIVPEHLKPVKQKQGLKKQPKELGGLIRRSFPVKAQDLTKEEWAALMATRRQEGPIPNEVVTVERWAKLEDFNPSSHLQVKALIKHFGHKPGKDRKSKNETSNDDTLRKLISTHLESKRESDQRAVEAYRLIREVRALGKVLGTYVMGWKPGADGRIHATPGVWGDMFRISWRRPNIAATVADKKEEQIAAGFRQCVRVSDDELIIESDWKGMEAVLVGYFAGDPEYMKLARLGVHDFMALHMLNMPIDANAPEGELKERFKWVKKQHPKTRDDAKHTIHGPWRPDAEVLTLHGWVRMDQYEAGTAIAEWEEGKIVFREPKELVWGEATSLIEMENTFFRAAVTHQHGFPVIGEKGKRTDKQACKVAPAKDQMFTSGMYKFGDVDIDVRLAAAIQADASLYHNQAVFHLVKGRKQQRLEAILGDRPYRKSFCGCHEGGIRYYIPASVVEPHLWILTAKQFNANVLTLTKERAEELLEEVFHWDGHIREHGKRPTKLYFNKNRESATWVQTIAHLLGYRMSFSSVDHHRGYPFYRLYLSKKNKTYAPREIKEVPYKGRVVCFRTTAGYFLVRYKDTIVVSCNTNYGMTPFLMAELYEMTRNKAARLQALYFDLFPKIRAWQQRTISQAHSETKLVNAWGYRLDFWNVYKWDSRRYAMLRKLWVQKQTGTLRNPSKRDLEYIQKIEAGIASGLSSDKAIQRLCYDRGDEAKSAISFLPRDSGAAMLKDALWELEERHQLASRGVLRGCAHDSILAVCRRPEVDWVAEALREAQERPVDRLGGLVIGVEQAIGSSWQKSVMATYERRETNEAILHNALAGSDSAPAGIHGD